MNRRKQFEKWGKIALVGLCILLVFRLVAEIKGKAVSADDPDEAVSQPRLNPASPGKTSRKGNGSVNFDVLQMRPLEKYVAKPLPNISRDPFDFGPPPITPAQRAEAQAALAAASASSANGQTRIPLRAIGYSERIGVGPEAYLTDSDQVYVVHDGDVISQRYKIVKITPMIVEVQDGASGETVQLPIPVVE